MNFENELQLGRGIYTTSEISQILRLPYEKVHRWMKNYWDRELSDAYKKQYSWKVDNSRAFSFHAFVEFYVMMELSEAGVKPMQVMKAHTDLSAMYDSAFPFAQKEVLGKIKTDGKTIYFDTDKGTVSLNGTKQFNLHFIKVFFKNLDFNGGSIANRFWPLGKDKSILIDPERKFGHPLINSNNIYPETIYNNYKAGDPIAYLAHVYELTEDQVKHAIEYCEVA